MEIQWSVSILSNAVSHISAGNFGSDNTAKQVSSRIRKRRRDFQGQKFALEDHQRKSKQLCNLIRRKRGTDQRQNCLGSLFARVYSESATRTKLFFCLSRVHSHKKKWRSVYKHTDCCFHRTFTYAAGCFNRAVKTSTSLDDDYDGGTMTTQIICINRERNSHDEGTVYTQLGKLWWWLSPLVIIGSLFSLDDHLGCIKNGMITHTAARRPMNLSCLHLNGQRQLINALSRQGPNGFVFSLGWR